MFQTLFERGDFKIMLVKSPLPPLCHRGGKKLRIEEPPRLLAILQISVLFFILKGEDP